jgi:hypothetical protein
MNSIKKLFAILSPKILNKYNFIALIYVCIIISVLQYPQLFSKLFYTTVGKLIMLIIIVFITNFNTIAGVISMGGMISLYTYLHDTGYEGFVEGMCPDPNNPDCAKQLTTPPPVPDIASTGKTVPSAIVGGEATDTLVTNKFAPAPVTPVTPLTATTVPPTTAAAPTITPTTNMVDLQLKAQQLVKPENSKTIPVMTSKNSATVEGFTPNTNTLSPSFIKRR